MKIDRTGETKRAANGMLMTIIEYRKSNDIDIQFEDGTIVRNRTISDFNRGLIKYPTKLKYIGNENINKQGRHMKIVDYKNNKEVTIQFDDGATIKRSLKSFVNGAVIHTNDIKSKNKKEKVPTEAEIAEKEFREELRKKCELAGIKYDTAMYYHRKHSDLSVDDIINRYSEQCTTETYNGKSIRQACKDLGINIGTVYKLKSDNKDLSYASIIDRLKNRKKSFAELCREHNINEVNAYAYKRRHTDKSDEEIIELILSKDKSFRQKCLEHNINYKYACEYKSKHPELTEEQIIEHCKQPKQRPNSLVQKCKDNNVSYSTVMKYKAKHPELTDEQIIDIIKNREATFKSLCDKYEVTYNTARTFRNHHPELSDEQVILAYRPDLRLNIFGEIINDNR